MNEESLELFLELAYQQLGHAIRHYWELVEKDGEKTAVETLKMSAEAARMKLFIEHGIGVPTPPEEAIAAAAFPLAAVFIDIEQAGLDFAMVGEDGWTLKPIDPSQT